MRHLLNELLLTVSIVLYVDDEGGVAVQITAYGAGYWLWLASIFATFVATAFPALVGSERPHDPR